MIQREVTQIRIFYMFTGEIQSAYSPQRHDRLETKVENGNKGDKSYNQIHDKNVQLGLKSTVILKIYRIIIISFGF